MKDQKATYRIEARRVRDWIDPHEDNPEDAVLHFFKAVQLQPADIVAAYWPKGREFDPRPIVHECLKRGHTCALPVVQKDSRVLKFARWDEAIALTEGPYNIMQPVIDQDTQWVAPDIVLVPLLAFDRRGNRLGQGSGHYDATLADLRKRKNITAAGVAYAQQACLFNLPVEPHDQKLNWIVTPRGAAHYHDSKKQNEKD